MPDDPDGAIDRLAAGLRRGSIVAAAGCGKTEQIARAVVVSKRRRLILTHTHAGVDAIGKRLKKHKVPTDKYRVDTIAGWCLRFAAAFPNRSGIAAVTPATTAEWDAIYAAAAQLIRSGAVTNIIDASYGGCFVDEYQDCTRLQHGVINGLADQLPTCVFGDPLQAIFDFHDQQPVDWGADVFPVFPKEAELVTPWRWRNAENPALAEWLHAMRQALERGDALDLAGRPACVSWTAFPADPKFQQSTVIRQCLDSMGEAGAGNLIVIGDGANVNRRTALAQKLAQQGFANLEPVSCKELFATAKAIDQLVGLPRVKAVLAFAAKCMTGVDKTDFERGMEARLQGRRLGQAKFGDLLPLTDAIIRTGTDASVLALLQALDERPATHLYRREMFFALRAALQIKSTRGAPSLSDAVWEVQNRVRHAGRRLGRRSIGSTLLAKGLEFDRAVIVHADSMTRKDWYVALTRATRSVRIISPATRLALPA